MNNKEPKSNKICICITLGIILSMFPFNSMKAQFNKEYPVLKKYRKFSWVAGPAIYDRAKIAKKYGDYTFKNYPIPGFNAGFEHDFHPEKKWSFTTGFWVALEPSYKIKYRIYEKDLFVSWDGDMVDRFTSYGMASFSAPFIARMKIQSGKRSFVNFNSGVKIMYFQEGSQYFGALVSDEELMETREVFGLKAETQEFEYYASYIIGTGYSYAADKFLLKANLMYVMNFQNTFEGEYLFGNLEQSGDSRGNYKLSGNYLALLFSIGFKKKEDW